MRSTVKLPGPSQRGIFDPLYGDESDPVIDRALDHGGRAGSYEVAEDELRAEEAEKERVRGLLLIERFIEEWPDTIKFVRERFVRTKLDPAVRGLGAAVRAVAANVVAEAATLALLRERRRRKAMDRLGSERGRLDADETAWWYDAMLSRIVDAMYLAEEWFVSRVWRYGAGQPRPVPEVEKGGNGVDEDG